MGMEQNFKKNSVYPPEKQLQVYKPCILNCGNSHPFRSLKYCPLAISKNCNELKKIVQFGSKKCCFSCWYPTRPGHNRNTCKYKHAKCLVCENPHSTVFCQQNNTQDKFFKVNTSTQKFKNQHVNYAQ